MLPEVRSRPGPDLKFTDAGESENRQVFLGDGRSAVLSGNEKTPTGVAGV